MSDRDGFLLDQMMASLYVEDASGRIVRINEPDGDPAPRFALVRTVTGRRWRLRGDVPGEIAGEIERLLAASEPGAIDAELAPEEQRILELLQGAVGHFGPEFAFPPVMDAPQGATRIDESNRDLLLGLGWSMETLADHFAAREPYYVAIDSGAAVSICFSARSTPEMAMAGVETLPDFRGRGHAARVTAAWAADVLRSGRTPLYGTTWDNAGSRGVARTLGLRTIAASLTVE